MIVLGLDTTGADCAVCLVDDATVRAHISRRIGRGHAEILAGMVAEIFEMAGLQPRDVDRLAVCTGPGSFTGLRVALSFALGFSLPRNLPVIGMDALEMTANALLFSDNLKRVGVMQDVRRGEVFYASYDHGVALCPPQAMSMAQAESAARKADTPLHDTAVDTRILAWLSIDVDPDHYPPEPLYARGPDAKLPGGVAP